jgi:hypothetical protein
MIAAVDALFLLLQLAVPAAILFKGPGGATRVARIVRALLAIAAGYILLNLSVHALQALSLHIAQTPEEVRRVVDHDGAPRVFALVFGWIPAAAYVALLAAVHAIVSFARSSRRMNSQ